MSSPERPPAALECELRAAVRAVLGPDAPVLDGEQTAHDPQAHSRAGRSRFRRGTAVEALEEVRQVGRRDPRTVVAHLDDEPVRPRRRAVTFTTDPAGEY